MNTLHRVLLISAAILSLSSCALPQTKVIAGGERPTLALVGAPAYSELLVDGRLVGYADQYDGVRQILTLEEGTHTIVVRLNGRVLHSEKIFVSTDETKRIEIGTSTQK